MLMPTSNACKLKTRTQVKCVVLHFQENIEYNMTGLLIGTPEDSTRILFKEFSGLMTEVIKSADL